MELIAISKDVNLIALNTKADDWMNGADNLLSEIFSQDDLSTLQYKVGASLYIRLKLKLKNKTPFVI